MKIVINRVHGGFSLSRKAEVAYLKLKGKRAFFYEHNFEEDIYTRIKEDENPYITFTMTKDFGKVISKAAVVKAFDNHYFYDRDVERKDKDLVRVVEELGEEANGRHAELAIVEVPDDVVWAVEEYDGLEWVAEKHRTWYA